MCGIVGYVGRRQAAPLLLDGLARLEYRGYDSAGVTVQNGRGLITHKLAGRVAALRAELAGVGVDGRSGIAHTRWATHGAPTTVNAHPHGDCTGRLAVVHNGILENADALRTEMEAAGHRVISGTDTELIAHLIEQEAGPLAERVIRTLGRLEGTYGLAVISADEPHTIIAAKRGSPVLIGVGDGEFLIASDAAAVVDHTRSVLYLNDGDVAVIRPEGYHVRSLDSGASPAAVVNIDWDVASIALGGYAHYMRKEIQEQPDTVAQTIRGRLVPDAGDARLDGLQLSLEEIRSLRRVLLVGCGTSWHAGLVGRHMLEELTGLPVDVEYASEFRHRPTVSLDHTLVVAISQSGETADTLAAMRVARQAGGRVVGLVNVVGSTIAREASGGVYLRAGPEIGVASTKAFTSQIVGLLLMGLFLGRRRDLASSTARLVVRELERLPDRIAQALTSDDATRTIAAGLVSTEHALYLGRGISVPVALEGALKLKEVSYIHAEGYPAAEMKHGPIALVDQRMPVVFVVPEDRVFAKTVANMEEIKARGGRVIAVTTEGSGLSRRVADDVLVVPSIPSLLSPILTVIPLQLLAYHAAVLRGCDVDRPRNLAKSVTVE